MQNNYIISDNNNNILFVIDNLKLSFQIIINLYSVQIQLLINNNKDINKFKVSEYFISYNKDHLINKYHFKLVDNNILIYYNDDIATDENSILMIEYFRKKYGFNKEDIIKMKMELDEHMRKYEKIKQLYLNDKEIYEKLKIDIENNKIKKEEINPVFRNKYEFYQEREYLKIVNENELINEYEVKFL